MSKTLMLLIGLLGLAAASGRCFDDQAFASGQRTSLHGNGEPKERTTFVNGLRHGHTTRWYADGTVRAEGEFDHGQMIGEWIWQLPDGSLDAQRSGTYSSGVRISG